MSKLQGISPQVPLVYSQTDGPYELNKTLKQAIRQNLKMLILTSPGERIMIPDFGVGLYNFLFEQVNTNTFASVAQRIKEQVLFYMPSVNLVEVNFFTSDDDTSLQFNEVRVSIRYNILPFNESDQLIITSTMTN
jgi:phage baseplate assembly protein W|tara:strand:- start:358 stop:762 length:405 start_codon:yes stop_codon:yes gene_type:complete